MSWLLAVWISLGFLLLCQATLFQTIQQHHVARPGRTDILTLGTCAIMSDLSFTARCHNAGDAAALLGCKKQQQESAAVCLNDSPRCCTVTWWFTTLPAMHNKQRGRWLIVPLIACYILRLSQICIYILGNLWNEKVCLMLLFCLNVNIETQLHRVLLISQLVERWLLCGVRNTWLLHPESSWQTVKTSCGQKLLLLCW